LKAYFPHIFKSTQRGGGPTEMCSCRGHEWEVEAAAGSNFSSVTPWPGWGCFGPRAERSFKTMCRNGCRSDHPFPYEKLWKDYLC